MKHFSYILIGLTSLLFINCKPKDSMKIEPIENLTNKVNQFATFPLKTDLEKLTVNEKEMLPYLIDAAKIMDDLFWKVAWGDKSALLENVSDDATRKFLQLNYGPWERLNGNTPFIKGIGEKPAGANFYPPDMTVEEFELLEDSLKNSLYTILQRNESGNLIVTPYSIAFKSELTAASELLEKASTYADDPGLKNYLKLRAKALLSDNYFDSDTAWMAMKNNTLDIVIGPIENYEDALFGYKAAFEAYILVKDQIWSEKLTKYAALLPDLQRGLPVSDNFKKESPGTDSDLNAYDVIYYAGDCNAGSKTIAINLPNDEEVQLMKGSRRLQLKNSMQAKFEKIMVPISEILICEEQRSHVTFDAFFANTMFHEVAHGLGIKQTINGKGTVRESLKENFSALEEGKADILGIYMVSKLKEMGEYNTDIEDNYVTFMAGIFRSIRFGASSSHGRANLIRYNYFKEKNVFTINEDGTYKINFDKMQEAVNSLSELILTIQGLGDYESTAMLLKEKGVIDDDLNKALAKVNENNIPLDIVFEQGKDVLGL